VYLNHPGANVYMGVMRYGACAANHLRTDAGQLSLGGNYTISGSAVRHILMGARSTILGSGITVTLSGTPAWSSEFALVQTPGLLSLYSVTYSGSATGKRYTVTLNGVINTFGGGASYLPGNSAGSTATGGQYA
jgi:hypothetical protein